MKEDKRVILAIVLCLFFIFLGMFGFVLAYVTKDEVLRFIIGLFSFASICIGICCSNYD